MITLSDTAAVAILKVLGHLSSNEMREKYDLEAHERTALFALCGQIDHEYSRASREGEGV